MNGRLDRFTLDRLLRLANAAGLDVTMTIEPVPESERSGRTVVTSVRSIPGD
jgi:hypothetical protein